MLKLSENPPMVGLGRETLMEMPGRWWIAHTKARFEKAFAWDLTRMGTGYFLPMLERVRMSGGRKRRVLMPMFSSYVFFCGDEETRYGALATDRLCQVIEVRDQAKLREELTVIEKAIGKRAELDFYPQAAIGQRCRVTAGPFEGLEGVVVQRNGMTRLVLQVSMLGQGASLEIDADLLEVAEEEKRIQGPGFRIQEENHV